MTSNNRLMVWSPLLSVRRYRNAPVRAKRQSTAKADWTSCFQCSIRRELLLSSGSWNICNACYFQLPGSSIATGKNESQDSIFGSSTPETFCTVSKVVQLRRRNHFLFPFWLRQTSQRGRAAAAAPAGSPLHSHPIIYSLSRPCHLTISSLTMWTTVAGRRFIARGGYKSQPQARFLSASAKVWINKDTRVICQGFTGKQVRFRNCNESQRTSTPFDLAVTSPRSPRP
jgi:hypothetical protein